MADEQIGISDALKVDGAEDRIRDIITLMRMALAPMFNDDIDNIPMNQSYTITAAALFAGMTAGHMIALGTMKDQDKRRAGEVVLKNFRNGIDLGKSEARKAMLEQLPAEGQA